MHITRIFYYSISKGALIVIYIRILFSQNLMSLFVFSWTAKENLIFEPHLAKFLGGSYVPPHLLQPPILYQEELGTFSNAEESE